MISADARAVIAASMGCQCSGAAAERSCTVNTRPSTAANCATGLISDMRSRRAISRVVQRRRNHGLRCLTVQRGAGAVRQARLHHGLAQFLDEQRNAVGARDDLGTHLWRHRPAGRIVPQQLLRLLTVEPGKRQVHQSASRAAV